MIAESVAIGKGATILAATKVGLVANAILYGIGIGTGFYLANKFIIPLFDKKEDEIRQERARKEFMEALDLAAASMPEKGSG